MLIGVFTSRYGCALQGCVLKQIVLKHCNELLTIKALWIYIYIYVHLYTHTLSSFKTAIPMVYP